MCIKTARVSFSGKFRSDFPRLYRPSFSSLSSGRAQCKNCSTAAPLSRIDVTNLQNWKTPRFNAYIIHTRVHVFYIHGHVGSVSCMCIWTNTFTWIDVGTHIQKQKRHVGKERERERERDSPRNTSIENSRSLFQRTLRSSTLARAASGYRERWQRWQWWQWWVWRTWGPRWYNGQVARLHRFFLSFSCKLCVAASLALFALHRKSFRWNMNRICAAAARLLLPSKARVHCSAAIIYRRLYSVGIFRADTIG